LSIVLPVGLGNDFRPEEGQFVVVPQTVVEAALEFQRPPFDTAEAGGILIGQYRGPHIELVTCTVPLQGDVRTKFGFERNDAGHAARAKEAWERSGRVQTFVGEWHTHPEDHPIPSHVDFRTWRQLQRELRDDPLVFMIFGRAGIWCGLGLREALMSLDLVD
jgi:integrative and conjugative element protein (TIGR02256 family)